MSNRQQFVNLLALQINLASFHSFLEAKFDPMNTFYTSCSAPNKQKLKVRCQTKFVSVRCLEAHREVSLGLGHK